MTDLVPHIGNQNERCPELKNLEKKLHELADLFQKLPLKDSAKQQFLDQQIKFNSAWYSCLVNSNIDELLLPEYLESRLNRNILIKKETEQYYKSVQQFKTHQSKKDADLYEVLLYSENIKSTVGLDLFSTQKPEKVSCPPSLLHLFKKWEANSPHTNALESLFSSAAEWFEFNDFSFSNQRTFVLWFNYKLYTLFGETYQVLNVEHFLFHQWKKKESDKGQYIHKLIAYLSEKASLVKTALRVMYRNELDFEHMQPRQKLASNYLFENAFQIKALSNPSIEASSTYKLIVQKGFVKHSDFNGKAELENDIPQMRYLLDQGIIVILAESEEIGLYINTSLMNKDSRLFAFQNIRSVEDKFGLNDFINQVIVKPVSIVPQQQATVDHIQVTSTKRQKAFFG